ncbi:MAG: hypothetical protein ABIH63_04385 [archaeon]
MSLTFIKQMLKDGMEERELRTLLVTDFTQEELDILIQEASEQLKQEAEEQQARQKIEAEPSDLTGFCMFCQTKRRIINPQVETISTTKKLKVKCVFKDTCSRWKIPKEVKKTERIKGKCEVCNKTITTFI